VGAAVTAANRYDVAEVRLGPGDCVVQNGTRHRWHNRTSRPCVIAVALLGMTRPTPDH
jgi:hypothetical protein